MNQTGRTHATDEEKTNRRKTRKQKPEAVPYTVTVARLLVALFDHNAYTTKRSVSVERLSMYTSLCIDEVIDAAEGLITKKYIVIRMEFPIGIPNRYFLASAPHVEDYAQYLREQAGRIVCDAKALEKLGRRLDSDSSAST